MTSQWSRRRVLGAGGAILGAGLAAAAWSGPALAAPGSATGGAGHGRGGDPWRQAGQIRHRVRAHAPHFPPRTYRVTDYGAVGDGSTDCTRAFAAAITACSRRGGGHVVVPPGRYATGTTKYALDMQGYPDDHISDITLEDCVFDHASEPNIVTNVDDLQLINVTINGVPAKAPVTSAAPVG